MITLTAFRHLECADYTVYCCIWLLKVTKNSVLIVTTTSIDNDHLSKICYHSFVLLLNSEVTLKTSNKIKV